MIVEKMNWRGYVVYLLLDEDGRPVKEVAMYIKHLVLKEYSPYTLKTYCTALKFYFEFLDGVGLELGEVGVRDLRNFVLWLKTSHSQNSKIIRLDAEPTRSPKTTNLYITIICEFYRFLAAEELVPPELAIKFETARRSKVGSRTVPGFLSHVARSYGVKSHNVLKAKIPRSRPKILSPEVASALFESASNERDRFLITLLLETGLRIGEVLGLFVEDFHHDRMTDRYSVEVVDRGYHPNGGSAKSGGRSVPVTEELVEMFDDYLFDILENASTEHSYVFVKVRGERAGEPMDYEDVRSAFERYSKKIGVHVTPHMCRHTFGTLLFAETKDIKLVQELLGHAHSNTTADIYLHPSQDDVYEEWSKAKGALSVAGVMKNVHGISLQASAGEDYPV